MDGTRLYKQKILIYFITLPFICVFSPGPPTLELLSSINNKQQMLVKM